ncbi:MAG: methyltransferase domain-containing protein [Holophagales bacterium]|nr:methyltransferase domain-containing protein [Holophagales bacterium]
MSPLPVFAPQRLASHFELIAAALGRGEPRTRSALGRNLHFGYWDSAPREVNADGFARATERLSSEVTGELCLGRRGRLLDVGCGYGGTLARLRQHRPELRLVGLDCGIGQLARCREVVAHGHRYRGKSRARLVAGDACRLPVARGSCDGILAMECLFYLPSRELFFREVARVLRPGGRLVACDFVATPALSRWLRTPLSGTGWLPPSRRIDIGFTERAYRELAVECGLHTTRTRDITANILPSYAFLRQLLCQLEETLAARLYTSGDYRVGEWLARSGALRYTILAFEKPARARIPHEDHREKP